MRINYTLGRLFRLGESLLSPKSKRCAYCGQLSKSYAEPSLALCKRCSTDIPWIRSVQCRTCGRAETCGDCVRRGDSSLLFNRAAVHYDERMREWLALYKYRGNERLQQLFSAMLHKTFAQCADEYARDGAIDWITFVPVSTARAEERGFNQAEQLAKGLSELCGIPVVPLLKRNRDTVKQSTKSRSARLHDLEGVFSIEPAGLKRVMENTRVRPLNIVIIDDVYTTGSTLHRCAEAICSSADARVYGLTWAR